jgi:hypothetical protein
MRNTPRVARVALLGASCQSTARACPEVARPGQAISQVQGRLIGMHGGLRRRLGKPHDPAFIKNAGVDDVKGALRAAGLTDEFVSIPLRRSS